LGTKLLSSLNLLVSEEGLFRSQGPRTGLAFDGAGKAAVGATTSLGVLAQGHPGLLHLLVRSDKEPRRMGLRLTASWRSGVGGDRLFMVWRHALSVLWLIIIHIVVYYHPCIGGCDRYDSQECY
jgi:hypothetical protein